jgi:hypothetical protein
VIALLLVLLGYVPQQGMHIDPSASLSTSSITDMRGWVCNRGIAAGLGVGGRELDWMSE